MLRRSDVLPAMIKNALDVVSVVGEYLPLHRTGSTYKALCPFHDDHNPSMEVNVKRQTFKCWSCGAGGDLFDFVMRFERVDFPEALQILGDRAGIPIDESYEQHPSKGPGKPDLFVVNAWAEKRYQGALVGSAEAREYLERRQISTDMIERFRLGYAPDSRRWLWEQARRDLIDTTVLEAAGLSVADANGTGPLRDRFRGRLLFPIHDIRGRTIGFGGRILPTIEQQLEASGHRVVKYLNTAETTLFHKRRTLYGVDLAREGARREGQIVVVEGYTDVIAAHQFGFEHTVGTLGTALGEEHVQLLRRLADRIVLVFDGDDAGRSAADRSLEFFLNHELDVRVLNLPTGYDPCQFLMDHGPEAFRRLIQDAADPLTHVIDRASIRFEVDQVDGARRASAEVLELLARSRPETNFAGLDLATAKALDRLAQRLRLPVESLQRDLLQRRRSLAQRAAKKRRRSDQVDAAADSTTLGVSTSETEMVRIDPKTFDRLDRELIEIILEQPAVVKELITRITPSSMRDRPLQVILQVCFELHGEGLEPTASAIISRLDDPALRSLVAELVTPFDPRQLSERYRKDARFLPPDWSVRLAGLVPQLAERSRRERLRALNGALAELDPQEEPDRYRALWEEKHSLLRKSPATVLSSTLPNAQTSPPVT